MSPREKKKHTAGQFTVPEIASSMYYCVFFNSKTLSSWNPCRHGKDCISQLSWMQVQSYEQSSLQWNGRITEGCYRTASKELTQQSIVELRQQPLFSAFSLTLHILLISVAWQFVLVALGIESGPHTRRANTLSLNYTPPQFSNASRILHREQFWWHYSAPGLPQVSLGWFTTGIFQWVSSRGFPLHPASTLESE